MHDPHTLAAFQSPDTFTHQLIGYEKTEDAPSPKALHRYDYQLQETFIENMTDYANIVSSHVAYWYAQHRDSNHSLKHQRAFRDNKDVAFFILCNLLEKGIFDKNA